MKLSIVAISFIGLAAANPLEFPDFTWPAWMRQTVDSKGLRGEIRTRNLVKHAEIWESFSDKSKDKNRAFGGKGHNDTVDYLYHKLKGHYKVTKQPFVKLFSSGDAKLTVDGKDQDAGTFTYAPAGKISSDIVPVNALGCELTDFPDTVNGKIALISRGTCEFGKKSALAGAKGAKGAIIYNNVPEGKLEGTFGSPERVEGKYVPTAGLSQKAGQDILAAISGGKTVKGDIVVNAVIENRTTYNVIAETWEGDKNNVLVVGGHTDSVPAGAGINDNGSGSIGILEVALRLCKYKVKNAVRFTFFSAEEFGLLGSHHYVDNLSLEERKKIRAYLNFDMIASPNPMRGIYDGDGNAFNTTGPAGSAELEHMFEGFFDSQKLPHNPTEFSGRSDYGPFLEVNIPAGGLFTGAETPKTEEQAKLYGGTAGAPLDPNYHKIGDRVSNLDLKMWLSNVQAIAHAVATYGTSWKSMPPAPGPLPPKAPGAPEKRDNIRSGEVPPHAGRCGHVMDEL